MSDIMHASYALTQLEFEIKQLIGDFEKTYYPLTVESIDLTRTSILMTKVTVLQFVEVYTALHPLRGKNNV